MADEKHENWNNDFEFWLVYMGAVVGYGCIWRFPYLMYGNGGITFLIPFFTILIIVGIPQTYIQSAIGQYFREPMTQIYSRVSRKWAGAAIMNCMIVLVLSTNYILLLAYCLMYMCLSFMNPWPWASETPEADSKSLIQKSWGIPLATVGSVYSLLASLLHLFEKWSPANWPHRVGDCTWPVCSACGSWGAGPVSR
jgi:SNF family Na+-dependent transporter